MELSNHIKLNHALTEFAAKYVIERFKVLYEADAQVLLSNGTVTLTSKVSQY